MKRLCLLLGWLLMLAAPAVAAPKLVVESLEHDFGRVFQGERVDHTFRFTNAGDAPLHIAKVRSSCGCTAALLSSKVIPPGEKGQIKASFDSTRFRGDVVKSIYLYSDAANRGEARFILRGRVQEELVVNPQQVILRDLAPGREQSVTLTLMNRGERDISLAQVETSTPEVAAEPGRTRLAPGQSTPLRVRVSPGPQARRISGYVFVRTVGGRTPEIRIPVQATLKEN